MRSKGTDQECILQKMTDMKTDHVIDAGGFALKILASKHLVISVATTQWSMRPSG